MIDFWSQYVTFGIQPISLDFEEIKKRWDFLSNELFEHLEKKLLNPIESIVPNEKLLSTVEGFKTFQTSISQYKEQLSEVNNSIQKKKESVKTGNLNEAKEELIKIQNKQKRYSAEAVPLCDGYKTIKNEKKELEKQKKKMKRDLKQLTDDLIAEYQTNINKYLVEKFGADFRIANQQTGYPGGRPSVDYDIELNAQCIPLGDSKTPEDQPSFRNTLSEGDKSTLAFAFFLARLDQDKSIAEKIIVFDDPINSLDIHRRNSTIQSIFHVAQKAKQVIVQTHDPIFARYLWREIDKSSIKCLCVKRQGKSNVIKEWDIEKETAGEYFQNYFGLEKFLEDGRGDLRAVARCIRPLLEGNLRLRFPGSFKENDWLGNFISNIKNADNNDSLYLIKVHSDELEEINRYSKQYHHSTNLNADNMPINETELRSYVKRTLKFIGLTFNVEDL